MSAATPLKNNLFAAFCALLLLGGVHTAQAQEEFSDHPGYVNFESLGEAFDMAPSIEVNVHGVLMEMAAEATRESEPEVSDLLEHLVAVQVRGFDVDSGDREAFLRHTQDIAERLDRQGWQTVVHVREDDEQVDIMLNERAGGIAGLLVMIVGDDDERVFVNVVGDIRPEQLTLLGDAFDIDPLRDLN